MRLGQVVTSTLYYEQILHMSHYRINGFTIHGYQWTEWESIRRAWQFHALEDGKHIHCLVL